MYAVYRIEIEEYSPGIGWIDDGCIYSTDKIKAEREAQRRLLTCNCNQERSRASQAKIVVVHETFLRDLKTTPVLSTIKGLHPADRGLLKEYSAAVIQARSNATVRQTSIQIQMPGFQHLSNTSGLSPAH
jgi:hypothetical protein